MLWKYTQIYVLLLYAQNYNYMLDGIKQLLKMPFLSTYVKVHLFSLITEWVSSIIIYNIFIKLTKWKIQRWDVKKPLWLFWGWADTGVSKLQQWIIWVKQNPTYNNIK